MLVCAVICRLSPRPDGNYEGVEDQEKWGRAYAAELWPDLPVKVYAGRGISAANGDYRPELEEFREDLAAGRVAHVCATEQSRISRETDGRYPWFKLANEMVDAGVHEVHTKRDGIVRVQDEVAGIKAVLAAGEVRKLKLRVNDKLDENAAQGRPPGSKPFGYEHGVNEDGVKTYHQVPEQAEAIRWAAERVLAGWSLSSVAAALRERGLTGAHGGMLTAGSVRQMLTNATVAGHRVHSGRDLGKGTGNWPAILSEDVWQACKAALAIDRNVKRADGGTYEIGRQHRGVKRRVYILTGGLARCGVCGEPMGGQFLQKAGKPYLICTRPKTKDRKGHCTGVMLRETEQHVVDALFTELDKPEFLDLVAADDHAERREQIVNELTGIEAKRTELAGLWATGMSTAEWQAARDGLAEMERKLRAELAAKPPPPARVDIEQARASWPSMTLDEQRQFLRLFIERVTIKRATPGRKGFDPGRVAITWRMAQGGP